MSSTVVSALTTSSKRSRRSRKSGYTSFTRRTVPLPVKAYVKRAIASSEENKVTIRYFSHAGISATDVATLPLILNLVDNTVQGTGVCNRLGNKIKIKKCILDITMARSSATGPANPPLYVTVVIARVKNGYDTPVLADLNNLKLGDSTAGTETVTGIYSADLRTMMSPYNKDYWDIKKIKHFKIWNAGNSTAGTTFINNDFKTMVNMKINVAKYMKKLWTFSPGNNFPQNEGLFAMFFANTIDDSATFTNAIYVDSVLETHFEDS